MKILVTGRTGQVGWRLERLLPAIGETIAADRDAIDLAQPDRVREALRAIRPDVIVNAAGYTNVDAAESDAATAHTVNAVSPAIMAEEAKRLGAVFVHYSSVYLYDGLKTAPYVETDEPAPLNVYGHSKRAGDEAVEAVGGDYVILRASWVYDMRGRNFLLTMLRLAQTRELLQVVDDQIGSPTWAHSIAAATVAILREPQRARDASGVYNLSALGGVSRYDFTRRILALTRELRGNRADPQLKAIRTPDFPVPADRPLNSVLDNTRIMRTFGLPLDTWEDQLRGCLAELDPESVSGAAA